jgi:DNA repair protein RecN (Recombination protein N)
VLVELRLENYAVIDNVVVEFASGLNLLTGETGAGKSILIDALALLLGERASSDVIRSGAEKAVVAAVWELESSAAKKVSEVLSENGLDEEGDSLILRREVATGGKGRIFVNNQPATVTTLKRLAPHLATIHAQNETLLSFDAASRLQLLDTFAVSNTEATAQAYAAWKALGDRIAELERDEQDRLRLLDLWSFQAREIDDARLKPQEDELLEAEKRVLTNSEKIYNAGMNAFDLLYEGSASTSATLRSASKHVEELSRYEPKFRAALETLDSARISIEDVGASLRDYAGAIQASPERLADVEDRLAAIDRLKRKYGPTLDDVLRFGAEATRKLQELENKDEVLRDLRQKQTAAAQAYLVAAKALSKIRQDAAKKLEKLVEAAINDLAMKAVFQVAVTSSEGASSWFVKGFDEVRYMISANPGEPLRDMEQAASGGELSRVMLALKSCIETTSWGTNTGAKKAGRGQRNDAQRTMVFDEIDSGIGGRAADAVGKKLKALARTAQVLCVTHLPQIAAFADQHYLIEKKTAAGRTNTTVRRIENKERTEEVARMLSGAKLTEASIRNAEQMIAESA